MTILGKYPTSLYSQFPAWKQGALRSSGQKVDFYSFFRQAYIRKLMEKIRFPLMPPRDLMVHVNVVDFMRTKCNDLLLEVCK